MRETWVTLNEMQEMDRRTLAQEGEVLNPNEYCTSYGYRMMPLSDGQEQDLRALAESGRVITRADFWRDYGSHTVYDVLTDLDPLTVEMWERVFPQPTERDRRVHKVLRPEEGSVVSLRWHTLEVA